MWHVVDTLRPPPPGRGVLRRRAQAAKSQAERAYSAYPKPPGAAEADLEGSAATYLRRQRLSFLNMKSVNADWLQ
jgi:hypothetical protein